MVDVAPFDGSDPVESVRTIERELAKFSDELAGRDRWLILNKLDLLPEDEREAVCEDILQRLDWQGPVYRIAAISKQGTERLTQDIMNYMEERREEETEEE